MIESETDQTNGHPNGQADANNNDESKPLTLLIDENVADSKCLGESTDYSTQPVHSNDSSDVRSTNIASDNISQTPKIVTTETNVGSNVSNSTPTANYIPQQPKSERKAAKTLSVILLAFIITWTPYNVIALVRSNLDKGSQDYIPKTLWLTCYYLCYLNSTVNPVCYALCNAAFRRTYIRILKCQWTKSKRSVASQRYQQDENRRLHESKTNKYRHWMT